MKRYIGLLLAFVLIISSMHVSAVEQLTDFTNVDFQSDTVDSKPRTGTSSSVKNSRMRLISTGVITKQEGTNLYAHIGTSGQDLALQTNVFDLSDGIMYYGFKMRTLSDFDNEQVARVELIARSSSAPTITTLRFENNKVIFGSGNEEVWTMGDNEWHNYELRFNYNTNFVSLSIDGQLIANDRKLCETTVPGDFITNSNDNGSSVALYLSGGDGISVDVDDFRLAKSEQVNGSPELTIKYPCDGDKLGTINDIKPIISAIDVDGEIVSLDLYLNDVKFESLPEISETGDYIFNLNKLTEGEYSLHVVAVDDLGATTTSTKILFEITDTAFLIQQINAAQSVNDIATVFENYRTMFDVRPLKLDLYDSLALLDLAEPVQKSVLGKNFSEDEIGATQFYELFNTTAMLSVFNCNDGSLIKKAIELHNDMLNLEIGNESMYYALTNEGKESVSLNLSKCNNFESLTSIKQFFDDFVLLATINEASYGKLEQLFTTYETKLGLNMNDSISTLNSSQKDVAYKELAKVTFNDLSDIPNAVLDAVTNAKRTAVNRPTFSGGGGSGGGGSVANRYVGSANMQTDKIEDVVDNDKQDTVLDIDMPTEENTSFTDVSTSHWGYKYIESLADKGVISGDENGLFRPEEKITREEFVKLLVIAGNIKGTDGTIDFIDVKNDRWSYEYIRLAYSAGIVNGYEDGTFGLENFVSRQDATVFMYRAMKQLTINMENEKLETFIDHYEISDYAKEAVSAMIGTKIVSGYQNGNFEPEQTLTRAEAAALIERFIQKLNV